MRIASPRVVITGTVSDAHTWNLVYLRLFLEEAGCEAVVLGPNMTPAEVADACTRERPDLLVVSSVNGHGYRDGLGLAQDLRGRAALVGLPMVIGGQLGTDGPLGADQVRTLLAAGFTDVLQADTGGAALRRLAELVAAPAPGAAATA